ncbi:hypothetical protein D3C79_662800 [compost metagenome]
MHHVFRHAGEPQSLLGSLDPLTEQIKGQLALHSHPQGLAVLFKLPVIEATSGGQAHVDATVLLQLMGRLGRAPARQIGGGADYHHAHVRPYPHRHHVLVDALPQPDTAIEAPGDDIDEAVVHHQLHLDLRVGLEKWLELGPQQAARRVLAGGEAQIACGSTIALHYGPQHQFEIRQSGLQAGDDPLSHLSGRHTAGGTGQ